MGQYLSTCPRHLFCVMSASLMFDSEAFLLNKTGGGQKCTKQLLFGFYVKDFQL